MSEWQPIETAPRDGTHVIVAYDEIVGEARFDDEGGPHAGWYWTDQHWTDAVGGEAFYPTHWQPLPEPPK